MDNQDISISVIKKDHIEKVSGSLKYVGDIRLEDMLYAVLYRSPISYGEVINIHYPLLPEDYYIINSDNIPGAKHVKIIEEDQPIFADKWVNYIGEPMFLIAGKSLRVLKNLLKQVVVEFQEHDPILTLEQGIEEKDQKGVMTTYEFGERLEIIKEIEEKAYKIIEENYSTGYQEHVYLETQGMLGIYHKDEIIVHGSLQCPYYIKNALMSELNCKEDEVRVIQSPTGGGFGGKEDYPSMMACHAAIAAKITQKPVMLMFERREDMLVTTKRHPSKFTYRTAINKQGDILSMNVEVHLDGGANVGLSSVVLQRALLNSTGVYKIPHYHAKGYVVKTNTVPNGAFRGFGAPQSFAGIESHMEHVSKEASVDPLVYKMRYLVNQGDPTSTAGKFRDTILMNKMIEELKATVEYDEKKLAFQEFNQSSHRYKKGLGTSLFLHGCGFTGSGERDHIKATVKLEKSKDDRVAIKIASVDMGQGLITTMSKIVAKVLDLHYEDIAYPYPDTKYVPDSGPTVASRTTMIVGKLLERAAVKLKKEWKLGEHQEVTEDYIHEEMIPWDETKFSGDAYPAYSWGVNMIEVKVDTFTGNVELAKVYASYDIGKAIDERIIKGQIDGGMTQGIAYGYMEKMTSKNGEIQQKTITDYSPPTAMDVVNIQSKLYDNPYASGPYGAKGAGELMLVGGAPAVQSAIENALSVPFHQIPITPEMIIEKV